MLSLFLIIGLGLLIYFSGTAIQAYQEMRYLEWLMEQEEGRNG